jgi:hypothetical protein
MQDDKRFSARKLRECIYQVLICNNSRILSIIPGTDFSNDVLFSDQSPISKSSMVEKKPSRGHQYGCWKANRKQYHLALSLNLAIDALIIIKELQPPKGQRCQTLQHEFHNSHSHPTSSRLWPQWMLWLRSLGLLHLKRVW